jgi:YidC/Oxa1 family membrane protein insertase
VEKRTLLAMGICLGIMVLWYMVVVPRVWPTKPGGRGEGAPAAAAPGPGPAKPAPVERAAPVRRAVYPERKDPITLKSRHLRVDFTEKGAGIQSLAFRYPGPEDSVNLLLDREPGLPHFALRRLPDDPDKLDRSPWEVVEEKADSVTFGYLLANGVRVTKTFTLDKDKPRLDMSLLLELPRGNPQDPAPAEQTVQFEVLALNGLEHDSRYRYDYYFRGVALVDQGVKDHWRPDDVAKAEAAHFRASAIADPQQRQKEMKEAEEGYAVTSGKKEWVGLKNRYFAALVLPNPDARQRLSHYIFRPASKEAVAGANGLKNMNVAARTEGIKVGPEKLPPPLRFTAVVAPLKKEYFDGEMARATDLVTYGGNCASGCGAFGGIFSPLIWLIDLVAPAILWIMKGIASLTGNFGVAIILTTIVIRCFVFPLSKKSQVSMFRMQQLGPKLQVIRERYKDDPQKQNVESMRIFRENKINPMSGCFPLFLQMPVFIAMYSVFELSIELRREPFCLWIKDLSQPDYLAGPWKEQNFLILTVDGLNLLPILMTIIWFLQAYTAPRSPDPQMAAQQKMMLFMPIVFGLMCYTTASGLSLYFLVNSLLAMAEQKIIKKFFIKPMEKTAPA